MDKRPAVSRDDDRSPVHQPRLGDREAENRLCWPAVRVREAQHAFVKDENRSTLRIPLGGAQR
jgi:hypothetical protein